MELGHEPAIQLEGPRADGRERRRIPVRWMLGVALTGLSGLALIGSALYLDLDRQSNFAQAPEFAAAPHSESAESEARQPGQGRSTGAPGRHRRRQAIVQVADDDEDRRQGSAEGPALHAALDDADDGADRIRRRGAAVRSAQSSPMPRRKRAKRRPKPEPAAGRIRSRVFTSHDHHARPTRRRSRAN